MQLRRLALRGLSWTGGGMAASVIGQAVQVLIFARVLGPAEFGVFGIALVVTGFLSLYVDAGISGAVIHKQELSFEVLSTLYFFSFGLALILFIVLQAFVPFIAVFFRASSELTPLLRVTSLALLFWGAGRLFETVLQKHMRFRRLAFIEFVAAAVSLGAALLFLALEAGVWAMAAGFLVLHGVRMVLLMLFGARDANLVLHFSLSDLKGGFVSFGLFQFGERTVNFLAQRFDQILIGRLAGTVALGSYALAYSTVVQPLNKINPVLNKVIFPLFARIQRDVSRLGDSYLVTVNVVSLVNSALLCGFAATAPDLVPLVFGEKWAHSIPLFQVLGVVVLLRSIGNPAGMLALATGRADLGFYWNLGLCAVTIPVMYIGYRIAGILGVAEALAVLMALLHLPYYFLYIRKIIGPLGWRYTRRAFTPLMAGLAGWGAVHCSGLIPAGTPILRVLAAGFLFLAVFAAVNILADGSQIRGYWRSITGSHSAAEGES